MSYHHGDLRSSLIASALAILEESGPQEMTLRAVARRAGVSTAAPYHHFKNRNQLLASLALEGYQQLAEALEPAGSAEWLGRRYLQFAVDHPGLYAVMFSPALSDHREYPELHATGGRMLQQLGQRFGSPKVALTALAAWHGVASFHLGGVLHGNNNMPATPEVVELVSRQIGEWVGM